jgi:hypothetical protein
MSFVNEDVEPVYENTPRPLSNQTTQITVPG